jgi:hypothetical protein
LGPGAPGAPGAETIRKGGWPARYLIPIFTFLVGVGVGVLGAPDDNGSTRAAPASPTAAATEPAAQPNAEPNAEPNTGARW